MIGLGLIAAETSHVPIDCSALLDGCCSTNLRVASTMPESSLAWRANSPVSTIVVH